MTRRGPETWNKTAGARLRVVRSETQIEFWKGWDMAIAILVIVFAFAVVAFKSVHLIGPAQVGLVNKRFSFRKLPSDNPIAFRGEAGYQATLLTPGLRMALWPVNAVQKFPWVQVPAGEIGVVIAQVGQPLPIGAKSGVYKTQFGNFSDLVGFIEGGGQK
ncbi:MAG: hypothetical protein ABIP21_08675, partial [Acidimicrobiia bacterium]